MKQLFQDCVYTDDLDLAGTWASTTVSGTTNDVLITLATVNLMTAFYISGAALVLGAINKFFFQKNIWHLRIK
eukprot:gene11988-20262_t